MKAARPGGSFLKQIYDKLLLVVALVALLGSTLWLVMRITENRAVLRSGTFEQVPATVKQVVPLDTAAYQQALDSVRKPFQLPAQAGRTLIGDQRVSCVECGKPIPYSAATCPFCNAAQPAIKTSATDSDGDGIADDIETKLGLNPADPTDAAGDLDADLFTNLEEMRSGTNPSDAKDYPPPVSKLRVIKTMKIPFKLRFVGVSVVGEGQERYQLNLRTLERTYFPKMGEEIEGYKITSYEPKAPEGPTLILAQADKGIRLVKGKVLIVGDSYSAALISLLDGKMSRVAIGDAIQVKEQNYKVVDIGDTHVLVRDEQTGRDTTIGLLSEEEKLRLQSGVGGALQPVPSGLSPAGRVR